MSEYEVRVDISGKTYREDKLFSLSTKKALFDGNPVIGNCVSGEIELSVIEDTGNIPRGAIIKPYCRENGSNTWIPKGTYFIYNRKVDKDNGIVNILGYDAMLRTDKPYIQTSDQGNWPQADIKIVNEICERIEVTLDAATKSVIVNNYPIAYPGYGDGAYTMREMLGHIGGLYAGNWIISDEGHLKLITFTDFPAETNYLIDERGDVIVIGGVRILV